MYRFGCPSRRICEGSKEIYVDDHTGVASVVRHAECHLFKVRQALLTFSKMSEARAVQ